MNPLNLVIPVKHPGDAKQRLGEVLTQDQRTGLAVLLFERTLRLFMKFSEQMDVLVVTDSAEMAALARRHGAEVLLEDRAEGETKAVEKATAWSVERGYRSQLVVPGDMAVLQLADIAQLLEQERGDPSVILCPATDDDGTNALLCTPPDVIPYRFGQASFPEYQARARERNVPCHILRIPGFVLDLDTPDDVRTFMDGVGSHPARTLLEKWLIAEQIMMRGLEGIPEVQPGDDLGALMLAALQRSGLLLADGDIIVVAQKVVSKAEGRIVSLATIKPGAEARALARELNKDPRKVEVILGETEKVIRARRHPGRPEGVLICRHRLGFICANAGVDESNVPGADNVVLLPEDPDASARGLRDQLEKTTGRKVGVVVTDTFGRPWRRGLLNVALGLAGVPAVVDAAGTFDAQGRALTATAPALADELAAAAGLLMDKAGQTPVVLIRGVSWNETDNSGQDLLRDPAEDLFL